MDGDQHMRFTVHHVSHCKVYKSSDAMRVPIMPRPSDDHTVLESAPRMAPMKVGCHQQLVHTAPCASDNACSSTAATLYIPLRAPLPSREPHGTRQHPALKQPLNPSAAGILPAAAVPSPRMQQPAALMLADGRRTALAEGPAAEPADVGQPAPPSLDAALDELCLLHVASFLRTRRDLAALGLASRRLGGLVRAATPLWQRLLYLEFGLPVTVRHMVPSKRTAGGTAGPGPGPGAAGWWHAALLQWCVRLPATEGPFCAPCCAPRPPTTGRGALKACAGSLRWFRSSSSASQHLLLQLLMAIGPSLLSSLSCASRAWPPTVAAMSPSPSFG